MIRTRQEACSVLGLTIYATNSQVKTAYKELVKKYHPDVTGSNDVTMYEQITEAYQFLMTESKGKVMTHSRVVGKPQQRTTASNADYAAFQKKAARQKQKKAEEFAQKQKEFADKAKKQEADYKRAMEAIDAIRAARTLQAMIWANGLGKNNGDNEKAD
ncbi:J domain-containing protein [Pseudobutyrivibrio sp.]|uniref:J domain-containing protein n=1 Tax=Pseudobutyrivibrio sp. TaxID=2014367 RepID=UPI001D384E4B|nr:J domain-containing protein [Pseudobutyrivibrio sp.]MBE5912052.1 J domain-containing protein [Pseudobutyrivibrio sp.]